MGSENNYIVYLHQNKESGKMYFGATKQKPNKRWQYGHGYVKNSWFWKDIDAEGWDAFDHIICKTDLSKDEALKLEEELIQKYDTTNPEKGYNMRAGGKSNTPVPQVCINISKSKTGHEVAPEVREKLSRYGRLKVVQLTLDGEFVAIHDSITIAAKTVGSFKNNVWAVCKGRKKSCKGFKWMYLPDYEELQ